MIINKLKEELLKARKNKNTNLVSSVALMISEIEKVGKNDGNRETTDDEAVALLKKMVQRNNETLEYLGAGPMRDKYSQEVDLMQKYIPSQVSDEEVTEFVKRYISENGKNMGAIMGALKDEYGSRVDMKSASGIVRANM